MIYHYHYHTLYSASTSPRRVFICVLAVTITLSGSILIPCANASLIIPTDTASPFYYQLGGGRDVSLPPIEESTPINLDASLSIRPGYQCGVFNPAISLKSTLNQLHDALKSAEKAAVQNATAAIAEFPMYELARANPTLYNILNNNLLHAHEKITLATKSCEQMQSEIASGHNPYKEWATLAVGHQWEKHISLALDKEDTSMKDADNSPASITHAKADIDAHVGEAGVPWVQGKADPGSNQTFAGGKSQPSIRILHDTVVAGYKALQPDDGSVPAGHLVQVWPTSDQAADWVTHVLGDQTISTCNSTDCVKASTVGHGLLPLLTQCASKEKETDVPQAVNEDKHAVESPCAQQLATQLWALIRGQSDISKDTLSALSTPGLAISPVVITALQSLAPVPQALLVDKLSQAIALQRLIDKALLARRLLLTGAQVPLIASNAPARRAVVDAIHRLEKDVDALLWEKHIRTQTLATPLQQLLQYTAAQRHAVTPALLSAPHKALHNGAIQTIKKMN